MNRGLIRRLGRIRWVRALSQPFFWCKNSVYFLRSLFRFAGSVTAAGGTARPRIAWNELYPCLWDRTATTGFDAHYTYHPAWAARIIARRRAARHVDIGSSLHFCSLVSAFIPVDFYDYRPAQVLLTGLKLGQADLTALSFP